MTDRLKGKVVLVMGAGSVGDGWGNGRATAFVCAREGATVVGVDRSPEALAGTAEVLEGAGYSMSSVTGDVTSDESVAKIVATTVAEHGRIDVLINNVGGSAHGGATELSPEAWQRQIDLNLTSVYLALRHVVPVMKENGGGSIINTASTSGVRFTGSPQIAYAASKAAVIQVSKVSAVEFAPFGIRVNTVVPGQLHTPMVEARLAGQRAGGDVDALLRQRAARTPLQVSGDGRDTAHAALFLASDEARFITGSEITVDGGMSVRCN
ncbi:SDR family NAD(P)-dependent oxidoreductase [Pseudoclavibacter sp. 8L]|uniref:SDR family NAD(P)-dependent oxidoreductase n=1 Tax=Pseudoclavibacter sp. 8L TaxID=2653162 RepID=UPI0012F00B72|nr:SDR family NAD(P)-dependent oxidoreductase [Pseudoclavibacter sp. 8L]VXC06636.1 3-oxoacyl-ACP reductase [Pseudoclavibacter sp. 8L]